MLQLLTNYSYEYRHEVLRVAQEVLDAGFTSIQFAWNGPDKEQYILAEKLRRITKDYSADLTINNRLDIALGVGADTLHLGQQDIPAIVAASIIPKSLKLGLTVSSILELSLESTNYIDYYGVGPVFSSVTKPSAAIGIAALKTIVSSTNKPIIAIGGISDNNIVDIRDTGVYGASIIGAIYRSNNRYLAAKTLVSIYKDI